MDRINAFIVNLYTRLTGRDEDGQTLVEYALIIALVSIALVVGLQALEGGITGVFDDIVAEFGGGATPPATP
jgi:pilus assembly protein Flp/PilA